MVLDAVRILAIVFIRKIIIYAFGVQE